MKSADGGLDVARQALPGAQWRKMSGGFYCYVLDLRVECLVAADDYQLYTEYAGGGPPGSGQNPGTFRKWLRRRIEKQQVSLQAALEALQG